MHIRTKGLAGSTARACWWSGLNSNRIHAVCRYYQFLVGHTGIFLHGCAHSSQFQYAGRAHTVHVFLHEGYSRLGHCCNAGGTETMLLMLCHQSPSFGLYDVTAPQSHGSTTAWRMLLESTPMTGQRCCLG